MGSAAFRSPTDPCNTVIRIRQSAYLNNRIEQDHRAIKCRVRSMLGFKSMASARAILGGIEMIHMMRKGQAKYSCNRQVCLAARRRPSSPHRRTTKRLFPPQPCSGFATERHRLARSEFGRLKHRPEMIVSFFRYASFSVTELKWRSLGTIAVSVRGRPRGEEWHRLQVSPSCLIIRALSD